MTAFAPLCRLFAWIMSTQKDSVGDQWRGEATPILVQTM